MKVCIDCGTPASDETHYKPPSFRGIYSSRCKTCEKAKATSWKKANAVRHKESHRRWRLQSSCGITPEQWNELLASQAGVCGVCSATQPGAKDWHVDHDHVSGKVRGLLCHACNTAYTAHVEKHMEKLYEYHHKHASS